MGLRLIPRRSQPFGEQLSRRVLLNVMIESNTERRSNVYIILLRIFERILVRIGHAANIDYKAFTRLLFTYHIS